MARVKRKGQPEETGAEGKQKMPPLKGGATGKSEGGADALTFFVHRSRSGQKDCRPVAWKNESSE